MVFNYDDYLLHLLILQGLSFFTSIAIIIGLINYYIRNYKKKDAAKRNLGYLLFAVLAIMLFIASIYNLQFGYYLVDEKETDIVTTCGTINYFEQAQYKPRFSFNDKYVIPYIVTIDQENYYIMTKGEFEVTDSVCIGYLPDSKIILEISLEGENYD